VIACKSRSGDPCGGHADKIAVAFTHFDQMKGAIGAGESIQDKRALLHKACLPR
jgi:hypothetical protein